MDHKRDQKHPAVIALFNLISILFKFISLINLKLKGLKKHSFDKTIIISVDSLSFGGTGKTPAILEIGRILKNNRIKFAIITRGYKSKAEDTSVEVKITDSAEAIGDEALLIKKTFPDTDIFSGKKRIQSIKEIINKGNQVIVLDDGFQSTHIKKDIKLMLYNQFHPYFYLRNFKFLLKKEDLIFSYQKSLPSKPGSFSEDGLYYFKTGDTFNQDGQTYNLTDQSLLVFSALGDNQRFLHSLEGYNVKEFFPFKDHHSFSREDLILLNQRRENAQISFLLCTLKDFVKIKKLDLSNIPLLYITNQIVFDFDLSSYLLQKIR